LPFKCNLQRYTVGKMWEPLIITAQAFLFPCAHFALMTWIHGKSLQLGFWGRGGGELKNFVGAALDGSAGRRSPEDASEDLMPAAVAVVATAVAVVGLLYTLNAVVT
jgi:hypothetical protein